MPPSDAPDCSARKSAGVESGSHARHRRPAEAGAIPGAELGRRARGSGRVYLTGGATALLHGWHTSTVGIDLKLDPEPAGAFEAIAELKDELDVNVELAAPDQLLGALDRIRPDLVRYPGLDAPAFARRVRAFVEQRGG